MSAGPRLGRPLPGTSTRPRETMSVGGGGGHFFTDLIPIGTDYLAGISSAATGRDLIIVDRRELKDLLGRILRFGGAKPVPATAPAASPAVAATPAPVSVSGAER